MPELCPFDQSMMRIKRENCKSLGGFQYTIVTCPSCRFERKLLNTPIEEVYQFVYDQHDFIGQRLVDGNSEPDRPYIKAFLDNYSGKKNDSLVLEIGPGSGRNLLYAKNQGFKTATLDVSETNNHYYADVCHFDQVYNNFDHIPSDSVDIIFMTHVIEHVVEPKAILTHVHRVLKSGGILLISTPSTASLFKTVLQYDWWIYDIDDHVSFFNPLNLKNLLQQSSLNVVEISSKNTDATHALSAFVKKKKRFSSIRSNKTASQTGTQDDENMPKSSSTQNALRKAINSTFLLSERLGMGYEVVGIAKKP